MHMRIHAYTHVHTYAHRQATLVLQTRRLEARVVASSYEGAVVELSTLRYKSIVCMYMYMYMHMCMYV